MDDVRFGRTVRALRHRFGWRQSDLAERGGVSQDVVSRIERGALAGMPLDKIRREVAALQGELRTTLYWRGGDLGRLLDEGHAGLVGAVIALLRSTGWQVKAEVSYSEYGERGSIDVVAWHPATRSLLVIEVKTELVSVEETLRKHDEKARLAHRITASQFGWDARTTSRLLVLPDVSTQRRRVDRHEPVLRVACPTRGVAMRAWLKAPIDTGSGLLFVRPHQGRGAISRKRVRCSKAA